MCLSAYLKRLKPRYRAQGKSLPVFGRTGSERFILRTAWVGLLLWCGTPMAMASLPVLGENLEYTLKFRGWITGFVELDIAKLTLQVEGRMEEIIERPAYVTRMLLTTEPYAKAELLYPVRLSYRSWLDAGGLYPVIAVKSLRHDEDREELFWFDRETDYARHYQNDEKPGTEPITPPMKLRSVTELSPVLWEELVENRSVKMNGADALDYMGIYHRLRKMPFRDGESVDFVAFNGKEIEHFRVDMQSDHLQRAGWDRSAYRLTIREVDPENGDLGDDIQLWISDDDQRLLLRFYAERTFGAMEGILETGRPQLATTQEPLSEATRNSMETYLDF
ncbi:MAG: DUF3108 domain-containing protein [Candidatus Thiodiazotropha sp.]